MVLGIVVLVAGTSPAASVIHWMLLGVGSSMSEALQATILAAHVSRHELGAARSLLASIAIVASAVGPAVYGLILAASIPLSGRLWGTACVLIGATWLGAAAERTESRRRE